MDYWLLAFLGIAVWKVSRMLWTERGPLDIFVKLRAFFAKGQKRTGGLYDLISCFFCVSVWVGAIFALFISPDILTFLAYTFILSGIASLIHEVITILKNKQKESNASK